MFHGQYLKFECDHCERVIFERSLPSDWRWIKPQQGEPIRHACGHCQRHFPAHRLRLPGAKH